MAATVLLNTVPTYQYQCTQCGEALEVQQAFTDEALTVCPACEGRLRKVYNAVGVVFKGSGFYRTDSRATNGSGKDAAGASSSSTASSSSKSADSAGAGSSTAAAGSTSAS